METITDQHLSHGDRVVAEIEAHVALEIPPAVRDLVTKAKMAKANIDPQLRVEVIRHRQDAIDAKLREDLTQAYEAHETQATREDLQTLARLRAEASGEIRVEALLGSSEQAARQYRESVQLRRTAEVPGAIAAIQVLEDADAITELLEGFVDRADDFAMSTAGRAAVARLQALSKAEGQDDGPARRAARAAITMWDNYRAEHPTATQRQRAVRERIAGGQSRRQTDFQRFKRAHGL